MLGLEAPIEGSKKLPISSPGDFSFARKRLRTGYFSLGLPRASDQVKIDSSKIDRNHEEFRPGAGGVRVEKSFEQE
jgi:hypothetical protein